MSQDVTSLVLGVDSTQVLSASDALKSMAASGKLTESATSRLEASFKEASRGASATAAATAASAKGLTGFGNAARYSAHQSQQLAFQMQDFFVQIQAGQSPLTALIQQGSQLAGTFGGIGGAMGAVLSVFTPVTVGLGAVAAGLGGLAFSAYSAAKESSAIENALILTGNAAGKTRGQIEQMAAAIAVGTKTSASSTRDILTQLVESGRFTGEALDSAATAVQLLAKTSGQSSDDIVKSFVSATNGVARFAQETNQKYHVLSATQLAYIDTLEAQGRSQEALQVTFDALNGRLGTSALQVNTLESAWNRVKGAVTGATEAIQKMLGVGPVPTPEGTLSGIKNQLAELQNPNQQRLTVELNNPSIKAERLAQVQALQSQLGILERSVTVQHQLIAQDSQRTATAEAARLFDKLKEQSLTRQKRLTIELANANALADKSNASPEDRKAVLDDIRSKYADKSGAATSEALRKAMVEASMSKIKVDLEGYVNAYRNAESILEAVRASGILSEREYYESKREFVRLNADAEAGGVQKQIDELNKQKVAGKEAVEVERQLAEAAAKLVIIRANATAKITVLDETETTAKTKLTASIQNATAAQQAYVATLLQGYRVQLDGFGLGDKERERLEARQRVLQDFAQQRQRLEADRVTGQVKPDQYKEQLGLIESSQRQALEGLGEIFGEIDVKMQDWRTGATSAFKNYIDEAKNASAQAKEAFTSSFKSAENALVDFAMTGRVNFKGLVDSIISNILRMQAQALVAGATNWVGQALGLVAGAASGSGSASATTGPGITLGGVSAASASSFSTPMQAMPDLSAIQKSGPMSQAAQSPITQNITFNGGVTRNDLMSGMKQATDAAVTKIYEAKRRDGQ